MTSNYSSTYQLNIYLLQNYQSTYQLDIFLLKHYQSTCQLGYSKAVIWPADSDINSSCWALLSHQMDCLSHHVDIKGIVFLTAAETMEEICYSICLSIYTNDDYLKGRGERLIHNCKIYRGNNSNYYMLWLYDVLIR